MTNIVPFDFKGNSVRVIEIEGEPWFVGKDVAQALGLAPPNIDRVQDHVDFQRSGFERYQRTELYARDIAEGKRCEISQMEIAV